MSEYKEFQSPVFGYTLIAIAINSDKEKGERFYKKKLKKWGFTKEEYLKSFEAFHESAGLAIPLNGPYSIIAINKKYCKSNSKKERTLSIKTAAHECWHLLAHVLHCIGEHSNYMDSEVNIRVFEWAFKAILSMNYFSKQILR